MSSSISSFFSSLLTTVHADAEEKKEDAPTESEQEVAESPEEDSTESKQEEATKEEATEEEEEPEDIHPVLRNECKESSKCAALAKHFDHCQEKVESGNGYKGEDCVEELMMHCVDDCAGPKLFSKLR